MSAPFSAPITTFEIRSRQPSRIHPPIAERVFNTLDVMQLREDSGALEIAAHSIKFLIDPGGNGQRRRVRTRATFFKRQFLGFNAIWRTIPTKQ
jgi:hypothetical protein